MLIFCVALIISISLSVYISFQIDNIGGLEISWIAVFFYSSLYAIVEILKWPLGKRKIDNSKGLAKYIYGEASESFWVHPYFSPRESIINVEGKGSSAVWTGFIVALLFIPLSLWWVLFP